jgi:hypothetical protein
MEFLHVEENLFSERRLPEGGDKERR